VKFTLFFFLFVGGPKNLKIFFIALFQLGFVKRFFLLKQKNKKKIFFYWMSQKCCERWKLNFWRTKKFIGVSATKSWEKLRNFRYGLPKDFLSKGQKSVDSTPPPVLIGLERKHFQA